MFVQCFSANLHSYAVTFRRVPFKGTRLFFHGTTDANPHRRRLMLPYCTRRESIPSFIQFYPKLETTLYGFQICQTELVL